MDKLNRKVAADIRQVPPHVLELMLDVILEVMRAEHGSIMLLDEESNELSIKTARGLKEEIIHSARARLGRGIAGKVAASGQSLFLKGTAEKRQLEIGLEDLVHPEIDTAYVAPIKFVNGRAGVINIKSLHPNHEIKPEKEHLVQEILNRFSEYLLQVKLRPDSHESSSQLYMMNIFQEYNTLRELREVFDYIFQLIAEIMKTPKKGFFLLKNHESNFFDLILGYGFELNNYCEIYEKLIPQFKEIRFQPNGNITIFNIKDFSLSPNTFFNEELLVFMPLKLENSVKGYIVFFVDEAPRLDKTTNSFIQTICATTAQTMDVSVSGQKFRERVFVDSLTGTYNYGLWWKRLDEEFSRARRLKGTKISLIMIDIDRFDQLNLAHGYFVGDQLLRIIADRIKRSIRPIDIVGRIGGEEFGIALVNTEKKCSLNVINRIVDAVSEIPTEIRIKLSYPITLSCGISEYPKDAKDPGELVDRAKTALVSAKIMGGNCIKFFETLEE
ncbi:MAG: sensor domain-containing diguanylate cyclase [Candidatus Scalindua rubra]|uniref:diguanylate cyclase n=1 Tax=Candidatus Scalindua brodae TaxID=237368 RepID=A0A0B0EBS5_9BACT|nr:MAG: two-component response regulator [Candidatus Scalindua brodae]MBZ0108514.1 sensor domain-containing diguanylate cyclase [Candidatus Scalindua rubra]TWU36370.1 Phytochrome-like protein cph2 [Candidatus Brocadiaceae bacterium S225]